MEVILLERIERLGQMGDVVVVKDGFARNFLLPKNDPAFFLCWKFPNFYFDMTTKNKVFHYVKQIPSSHLTNHQSELSPIKFLFLLVYVIPH